MATNDIYMKCRGCIYLDNCDKQPETCNEGVVTTSFAYGTIASEEAHRNYSIEIGCGMPKIKSHLTVGNLIIHNTHHFNWLERKMWKLLLGFDVENVEE